uniref:HMG box domain-containing protein n=1 Tax=Globisporangium ultimum (strain ATCC 200006 / CBS 805.95 / DAOM BR144) TaxID=431595 RepID=K3WHB8_GLOUD
MAPIKRALSSYMIFCNDRRKQVAEENPGLRIGEIQKLISTQWKELSEQEKEHYVQLAAKDKERYEQEKRDNPVEVEEANSETGAQMAAASATACVYQLGRVKKIVHTDPEVGKVSREALIAISKASELLAQFLATKGYENALFQNKRQIKSSDITRAIQSTGSLDWLREDFPDVKPTTQSQADRSKTKKANAAPLPSGASFFKPQFSKKESGTVDNDGVDQEED